jgi:hypothetical protein
VSEAKIGGLLECHEPKSRWEASGVLVMGRQFLVVFDDRAQIGRFSDDLRPNGANGLVGMTDADFGYEGIAHNAAKQRYYLLVEARKHTGGHYQACAVEYDVDFKYVKERTIDFEFESDNKGFEAIAHVRRELNDYLLALCEGNKCKCGKAGRKPGGGRVQLFEKKRKRWAHVGTIKLPDHLPFVDYSGMAVDQGRVAVVSQVSSMMWVGEFDQAGWTWRDAGRLYEFPRFEDGTIRYGNIEGVGWISPTRIVTVSDRRKKSSQPDKRPGEKDQSIHVFDIS